MTEKRNKDRNVPTLRFSGFDENWKSSMIGELMDFKVTNSLSREKLNYTFGIVKNIHYGDIHTKFHTLFDIQNEEVPFINNDVPLNKIHEECFCKNGDLVFADASEDLNDIGKCIEILNTENQKLLAGLHTLLGRPKPNIFYPGFAGYLFLSQKVRTQIQREAQGAKVLGISVGRISKVELNYPSLDEQKKISKFLSIIDTRIQTQNKIIEQLESLIKAIGQYLFNQDKFEFNYIKLGEICEIKKGEQINGSELSEIGQYPVINGGIAPSGFHSEYNCNAGTITISEGGNSCGFVQFMTRQFWSGGHCYSLHNVNQSVQNKYLFYFLKYSESKMMSLRVGSGLPNIQRNAISNFEIIIPNEQTQTLTVNVLDAIYNKRESEKAILQLVKNQKNYFLNKLFK